MIAIVDRRSVDWLEEEAEKVSQVLQLAHRSFMADTGMAEIVRWTGEDAASRERWRQDRASLGRHALIGWSSCRRGSDEANAQPRC